MERASRLSLAMAMGARLWLVGLLALAVTGCALVQRDARDDAYRSLEGLPPEVPLPEDAVLDVAASFVLGEGARWTGRLAARTGMTAKETFDWYRTEMRREGWALLGSQLSEPSLLIFRRDARLALVDIRREGNGTAVRITGMPGP